jgi:HlyD family secretion protein
MYLKFFSLFILVGIGSFFYFNPNPYPSVHAEEIPTVFAEIRSFPVEVKAVGELEAARSTIIASSVRGDLGKIIYLVADGVTVKPGELLVKMDSAPFEEKIEKLTSQIKEQQSHILSLQKALDWEIEQSAHEKKSAEFEIESTQLELDKITQGDGPLEIARLKGAMQKAWLKYDELNHYSNDLIALEEQGFLNPAERRQAQKKLTEEQEAYETVRQQYESYIQHVHPMQIKKAETSLNRAKTKFEDVIKAGQYKIDKANMTFLQAQQSLRDYLYQLQEAQKELALTEIKAPAPGMVVQREEYRSGQRRKPRIGDILVKNQPLLDLPDLDSMIVKTKVREVDLYKVGIGKKATIDVDAYPQLSFSGTVSSIGVLAIADLMRSAEEKFFEVRVALDKSDERLRPGMTARAVIHAQQVDNCLTIPLHAVFTENKNHYCYVIGIEGYEKRQIELGSNNEQWAQVVAGLQEKDQICLINPLLADGE